LSADAVKLYKPSTKVYEVAPKRVRLKKTEILFVSSNSFDVIGAKNFGFKVCWINRSGVPLDPLGPKPDLIASNFDDLVEALSSRQTGGKSEAKRNPLLSTQ
jgi:2-haloacid dehalogenase